MSDFEFYFSYYGLILGLSVAAVIGGLARVLNARDEIRVGLLSPLLAAFMLVDITSFWIYAWQGREGLTVGWDTMLGATVIGSAYYLACSMLFPDRHDAWSRLDDHYWAKKRWIIGGVLIANLMAAVAYQFRRPLDFTSPAVLLSLAAFWGPTIALLFTRARWLDVVLLGWLVLFYGYAALMF